MLGSLVKTDHVYKEEQSTFVEMNITEIYIGSLKKNYVKWFGFVPNAGIHLFYFFV